MRSRFWHVLILSGTAALNLPGQEVRRALPAPSPTPTDQAPRALPVLRPELDQAPRAQPVYRPTNPAQQSILNENLPRLNQPEIHRPLDAPPEPKASSGSAAEPDLKPQDEDADGDIRIGPLQPMDAQRPADNAKSALAIADGLYLRKLYDLAVPEYEKFVGQYPTDPGRAAALYRLADCYSILGQEMPALSTYRMLINQIGTGEFVGSAAFRLGAREFDKKDYLDAAQLYEKAFNNAKSPEIKLTARYYQGKCLELSNKKSDAKIAYEDVVKTVDQNPFRDAARLSLAYYALENNQKDVALDLFDQLGSDAVKPTVKSEALTRAGILAAELKQKDKADKYFKSAVALNAEGKWKQIAQLEQMKLQYDGDKFSQVLDSYARNTNALGEETKPSVLLLVANSYRQLSKHQKALELYNQLIHQYPNTAEAYDARYQKLVSLDATKDPLLVPEVDSYLASNPNRDRADKAKLLKAQALFQQGRFDLAGKLYQELSNSSLSDAYRADCFYAAGFALVQTKDSRGAIQAFTGLIDKFPKHPMASKALLKRALLYQEAKNFPAAVNDFNKIATAYPASAERETALLQKGLTLGQQEDYPQMTLAFRQFLKDYPNSAGASQANYWIGWASFEAKKYSDAIAPLLKAREENPQEYAEKCSLRLLLCYQNLGNKDEAAHELDAFIEKDPSRVGFVSDVSRWLGTEYYNQNNFEGAAKYLQLVTNNADPAKIDKGLWFILARSLNETKAYQPASEAANHYLETATAPQDRAQGFLALGRAQIGLQLLDAAGKTAEQALELQPEGRFNADARMLIGDIESARGNYENAARSYMSVAVLYEDPEVTPRALEHAYEAFQRAGNASQAGKTLSELKNRFPNYQAKNTSAS
jgi:TolA-binding protein